MDEALYGSAIRDAAEGERIGAVVFERLADRFAETQAEKLRMLAALERAAFGKLKAVVDAHGLSLASEAEVAWNAMRICRNLRKLRWPILLRAIRDDVLPYVGWFDDLFAAAWPNDREALAYLAAHERALLAFLDAELEGRAGDPLADVMRLLRPESGI